MSILRIVFLTILFVLSAAGCGRPRVHGAHALLPAQTADTEHVWVYLDSENNAQDGVYRCSDSGQTPVCVRAELR